jgi:prophage DNA circulation protein
MTVIGGLRTGYMFECSFAGVPFDCENQRVTHGRQVVAHEHPGQDGAITEDMGRKARRISMSIIFIDHLFVGQGEGNLFERAEKFDDLLESGDVRQLVHPYLGVINCRIEEFDHSADGEGEPVIRASVTFVEDLFTPPVLAAVKASRAVVSVQEVEYEAGVSQILVDDAGLSAPVLATVVTEAEEWESSPSLTPREVQMRMSSLSNQLDQELHSFEAMTDLDSYPLVRSYTQLQHNLRNLAEAVTSKSPRIMKLTVTEPTPLRVLAGRFYSAKEADTRFVEMLDLNPGLHDPTLVPRGTELKVFAP